MITKHPVVIEFFPGLQFRSKLLGSAVPGRGLIIGFDIYTQLNDRLVIRTKGITFRQQFNPYTSMSKLFQISGDKERIGNLANTVFMFKKPRINTDEIAEYPPEVFTQFGDPLIHQL
uniref:Reverse transcriptase n=1 Tax=Solanum tuberosum TaxID=4113 RepID=M1E0J4_SOLTU